MGPFEPVIARLTRIFDTDDRNSRFMNYYFTEFWKFIAMRSLGFMGLFGSVFAQLSRIFGTDDGNSRSMDYYHGNFEKS